MADGTCRVCSCTEDHACLDEEVGPCWWIEPDLCSHCGEPALVAAEYDRLSASIRSDSPTYVPRVTAEISLAIMLWAKKARVALGRASTVDPLAFEPAMPADDRAPR